MPDIKTNTSTIKTQKFVVNGQEFSSFEDLPDEIKQKLDKDGNGKIDALENPMVQKVIGSLEINGKKLADWEGSAPALEQLKNLAEQFGATTTTTVSTRSTSELQPLEEVENTPTQVSQPLEQMWVRGLLLIIVLLVLYIIFRPNLGF